MIWSGYVYRHPIDDSMAPLLVPWVFDVFRLGKGLASDPTLDPARYYAIVQD